MASTETAQGSFPSLLDYAAQSAAEADGLPKPDASAAATLSSINNNCNARIAETGGITANFSALERARSAVTAVQAAPSPAATAGGAAHAMMSGAIPAMQQATTHAVPPQAVVSHPAPGPPVASTKKKGPPLRRGKWTPEEEAYANRLIQEFKAGLLPLTDGTTLRTFLSKLLNCDPMRISKKFVGGNCIGKQVFRRRTADINRLTPEQIQQSRAELSELERRFLERVAQTNRVKSSGVAGGATTAATSVALGTPKIEEKMGGEVAAPPSPPWLQPPLGYKHGAGAAMAAGGNSRAAAAGRALLQGMSGSRSSNNHLTSQGSAGLLALAELHRRNSAQNLLNRASANNLMAVAAASNGSSGLSGSAMAQMARNASAARLASLTAAGNSMNNLLMKAGFSHEQLSQLAREGASSSSLKNMMERQSSFDALMSLDFQSLQSIDNLANLIQTGAQGSNSENDMKNWSADIAAVAGSNGNLSSLASARRLASAGHMESLLRSLSNNNVNKSGEGMSSGGGSNANFNSVLQSMQSNLGSAENSASGLFGQGNAASALSLASMFRNDSSTGLSALRMQDGLNQRNTSVDDFLSLVTSGDIPHQDPLLSIPLIQQQQQGTSSNQNQSAALLAQQQLLAQASASGNTALANAIRSGSLSNVKNAMQSNASSSALKRKLQDLETSALESQGAAKR
jgi:hypothetical protein